MRISDIIGRFARSVPRQTSVQPAAVLLLERYLDVVEYGWIQQGNVSFTNLKNPEVFDSIRGAPPEVQVEVLLLALPELCGSLGDHGRRDKLHSVVSQLLSLPLSYSANDLRTAFGCLTSPPGGFGPLRFRGEYISLKPFVPSIRAQMQAGNVDASLYSLFTKARQIVEEVPYPPVEITRELREVLGEPLRIPILSADPWAVVALAELEPTRGTERAAWIALLSHAVAVSGARPTQKWLDSSEAMLDAVSKPAFRNAMERWLPRLSHSIVNGNEPGPVYDYNCDVLKGLIWFCAPLADSSLSTILADAALKCFESTKFGQVAPAAGNACILVLSGLPGREPQEQIERLKLKIKNKTALKLLDKSADAPAKPAAPAVRTVIEPNPKANVHARPEDLEERVPSDPPADKDEEPYCLKNGVLRWRGYDIVRGADIASFRFYLGGFAKDHKHCYHLDRRLQGGNPATFCMLNYTWGRVHSRFVGRIAVAMDAAISVISARTSPEGAASAAAQAIQPGDRIRQDLCALKGQLKQCHNHFHACICISYSTKTRARVITDRVRESLHRYMAAILADNDCHPVLLNSVEDPIHLLFDLGRTVSISTVVQEVKRTSSKWIKTQGPEFALFAWQSGYAVFAVEPANVVKVREYIANQREHHHIESFQDEYRRFLTANGVKYDERYMWD